MNLIYHSRYWSKLRLHQAQIESSIKTFIFEMNTSKSEILSSTCKIVNVPASVMFSFILLSVGDISNTFRNVYVGTT